VEAELLFIEQFLAIETQNLLVLPFEFTPKASQRLDGKFLGPIVV